MRRVVLMAIAIVAIALTSVVQAQQPPPTPPGRDPCSHGATGKDCRQDPGPGKDCLPHGQQGGNNEDHCLPPSNPNPTSTSVPPSTPAATSTTPAQTPTVPSGATATPVPTSVVPPSSTATPVPPAVPGTVTNCEGVNLVTRVIGTGVIISFIPNACLQPPLVLPPFFPPSIFPPAQPVLPVVPVQVIQPLPTARPQVVVQQPAPAVVPAAPAPIRPPALGDGGLLGKRSGNKLGFASGVVATFAIVYAGMWLLVRSGDNK